MTAISERPYLLDFSPLELKDLLVSWGKPAYRSNQIWQEIYHQYNLNPENFTTLPTNLRSQLNENCSLSHLHPVNSLTSLDGLTTKVLFKLPDNTHIESVLMRYEERQTLCISTQSGCSMGCVFCATGHLGFFRNLSSGEIIEQVLYFAGELAREGLPVTNIVLMGMGEPFLNYDAVITAIERLNDPESMNLGARRFTISTVGIIPGIERFTKENRQFNLAVSLHAANDKLRNELVPINRKYPLKFLMTACREYLATTHRRITFEWALIEGVNDLPTNARELVDLLRQMLCHVNIIPLNPISSYPGKQTNRNRVLEFQKILLDCGIPCTIRQRRGLDIQAGCGQLAALTTK